MTDEIRIEIERNAASWRSHKGESTELGGLAEVAHLGYYITARFAEHTKPWCGRGGHHLLGVANAVAEAVRVYFAHGGARPRANDCATRAVRGAAEHVTRGQKFKAEVCLSIEVTDPAWPKAKRGKFPVEDPWMLLYSPVLEDFLRERATRLYAAALAKGRAEHDAERARATAAALAKRARDEADEAGGFAARFAALREEQRLAREAAFRRIAAAAREALEGDTPIADAATDPGVRVVFGDEVTRFVSIVLAGEEHAVCVDRQRVD